MKLGRLGVWYSTDKLNGSQLADLMRAIENGGYSAFWYPESRGYESMSLAAYLLSLTPPANPNGFDAALIEQGQQVFEAQECGACHSGAAGTDLQAHDVGTGDPALEQRGTAFDTPTLRYLWLSAPYFHDGSAATLMDVFTQPGAHELVKTVDQADIDALIAYLLSWK